MSAAYVDLILLHLHVLLLSNNRLNKSRLAIYVDTVSTLQVLNIVVEESFIISQFLTNRYQADLVDGAFGAHSLKRKQQLFADIDNLARK